MPTGARSVTDAAANALRTLTFDQRMAAGLLVLMALLPLLSPVLGGSYLLLIGERVMIFAIAALSLELLIAGHDFVRRESERAAVYEGLGQRMSREAGDGADRSDLFRGSGAFLHNDPVDRSADVFGGTTTIHTGGSFDSYLLVPVIPKG
jgi:hypothetical protein